MMRCVRRDAVAASADAAEDGAEPRLERLSRLLQQRARRQARLMAAVRTLEKEAVAGSLHSRVERQRAHAGVSPSARRDPVGAAVLFRRKARLELCRRLREITPQASWVSRVMAPLLVGAHVAQDYAGTKGTGMPLSCPRSGGQPRAIWSYAGFASVRSRGARRRLRLQPPGGNLPHSGNDPTAPGGTVRVQFEFRATITFAAFFDDHRRN